MKYSVVIPVFERHDEVRELLDSLSLQDDKNFEVVIVDDGSKVPCEEIVLGYKDRLDIHFYYKTNSGPGASRNYGIERAKGEYIVLFDSDCVIPSDYFTKVTAFLKTNPLDCYGGPDAADASFSDVQKAINYAMTAFITTGGIRGQKKQLDNFQPRSFNMGFKRSIYDDVGGFRTIHPGEDPDLSYRIINAGYKVGLIADAYVYHKRRIDFSKFVKQVYKFGVVRNILMKWYPDKFSWVYFFPTVFLFGVISLVTLATFFKCGVFLLPLILFSLIAFIESLYKTKSVKIAFLSILSSYIQLLAYGYGFAKGFINIHILKKEEKIVFKSFFFE